MIKIQINKDKQYRIIDTAEGECELSEGEWKPTLTEAITTWMYPSDIAGFKPGCWDIEEVDEEESCVGIIPSGNIINMVMGKDFMNPTTYRSLTGWCMGVLDIQSKHISIDELNERVQKIDDLSLLLRLIEMADAGKRGCMNDQQNDAIAESIKNACLSRLVDFKDSLPPSLWHKAHRHELWMEESITEVVSLPSPDGWVSISGVRPSCHGAWKVKMQVGEETYESPQYVVGLGLKARHDGYEKGSHTGVTCKASHLFNHDGTFWGFEVYLISPKKTVGCEVTKGGRFSLFRKDVYLPPRWEIRQGDMLLKKLEYNGTPTEHRHDDGYGYGYNYWHPIERVHKEVMDSETIPEVKTWNEEPIALPRELFSVKLYQNGVEVDTKCINLSTIGGERYEPVLVVDQTTVLRHDDHPSIKIEAGYYLVHPVEGETDYQPSMRRGD